METLQAIFTRRSVRAYTKEPIPDEIFRRVLEAGRATASGGNVQPWGFVLVHLPERLVALRSLAPGIIGEPTAVICICLDVQRAVELGGAGGEQVAWLSVGLAAQNLLLAAHDLGLGACPVASFHQAGISIFLNLPTGVQPILLITLGYPAIKPTPPGRRPLSDICFAEIWGNPYE